MTENINALQKAFQKCVGKRNRGAISAVIFNGERILHSFYDGYINREEKIAPQADSLFMIGSNTKVFTSLGIFRLLEDGKLKLEDPITDYIPEFSVRSRIGEYPVTIENLLMHRGGIQCDLYEFFVGDKKYTDVVEGLKKTYRTSVPGEMFAYSNLGYALLGVIEERVSEKSYPDFMKEVLFDPLGMEVYYAPEKDLPESVRDRVACCYDKKGKRKQDLAGEMHPAGSCTYTTAESLASVGMLLMNDGVFKDKRLYREETIRLMKTMKVNDELDEALACVGYGLFHHALDLDYETGRILGHGGDTIYHHSFFDFLEEEKIGVIVLTNFAAGALLSREIGAALFNACLKENGFKEKTKNKKTYVSFDPEEYTGRYDSLPEPIEFAIDDKGRLTVTLKKIPFVLRKDEEGWLCGEPSPLWCRLPIIHNKMKGIRFLQTSYFGHDVLIGEQKGVKAVLGERHTTPNINTAWLKATGSYYCEDRRYKDLLQRALLHLKDGELVFTVFEEGQKIDCYLDVVNETEAIVKGYGRNAKQTIVLKNEKGDCSINMDGTVLKKK